jgi:hypothetical protein
VTVADSDVDIVGALVTLLAAAPLVAAVATVHGVELSPDAIGSMPTTALVVVPSGGLQPTQPSKAKLAHQRFDLFCYGKSHWSADSLRRVAAEALWSVERRVVTLPTGTKVLLHSVEPAGGLYASRDRDGAWPHSWQSFTVFYSTKEV